MDHYFSAILFSSLYVDRKKKNVKAVRRNPLIRCSFGLITVNLNIALGIGRERMLLSVKRLFRSDQKTLEHSWFI